MSAESPTESIETVIEAFALFDGWEERYGYIIELGQNLPPMDEALKVPQHLVKGCTSRVWLVATQQGARWHFIADSDAQIVRGLVYILLTIYQDKTPDEIGAANIENIFEQLGLSGQLSPSRRNGFFSMVQRIRALSGLDTTVTVSAH